MREVVIPFVFLHLIVTVVRLARPGGLRSVVAESLLVKHQLRILNQSRPQSCSQPAGRRAFHRRFVHPFHEPGTPVYQLVDQLRQDFEGGATCKCDTCKALGFPDFSTTNQKAGGSNPSGRATYPRIRQLQ